MTDVPSCVAGRRAHSYCEAKEPHLSDWRNRAAERARTRSLMAMVPCKGERALDVGARDGHFSRMLAARFDRVIALDLTTTEIGCAGVASVVGDVARLPFSDGAFDLVLCAEVLEHVHGLLHAATEITRVCRKHILVGVPFCEDNRLGATTCSRCGRENPPWGHVNTFDERRLRRLFASTRVLSTEYVGIRRTRTNMLSAWLLRRGGNPWGTYHQEEPCTYCGAVLQQPRERSLSQRIAAALGVRLQHAQALATRSTPNWIHMLLAKA